MWTSPMYSHEAISISITRPSGSLAFTFPVGEKLSSGRFAPIDSRTTTMKLSRVLSGACANEVTEARNEARTKNARVEFIVTPNVHNEGRAPLLRASLSIVGLDRSFELPDCGAC